MLGSFDRLPRNGTKTTGVCGDKTGEDGVKISGDGGVKISGDGGVTVGVVAGTGEEGGKIGEGVEITGG